MSEKTACTPAPLHPCTHANPAANPTFTYDDRAEVSRQLPQQLCRQRESCWSEFLHAISCLRSSTLLIDHLLELLPSSLTIEQYCNLSHQAPIMTHAASKDDLRVSTLFDVSNHVVLVTGGATGLGEMAAQAFIQNGATVFIASRKEKELKTTTDRLNALGPGKCSYIIADLKDKAGCLALCSELKKRTDRLTVLVNNTGASWGDDYYNYPEHAWDKLYALNVKSIFYMTVGCEELLLKGADKHNPGRVINIASMAGIQTLDVTTGEGGGLSKPGHGTYSCKSEAFVDDAGVGINCTTDGPAKAACIHLTKMTASSTLR